jgi:Fe-S oxidoreductase
MPAFHPAQATYFGLPAYLITWFIVISGLSLFGYVLYRRVQILRSGQADPRLSSFRERISSLVTFGFIQKRQPRYLVSGLIHLMIFWGFVVLGLRSIHLVAQGLNLSFLDPLLNGPFGAFYGSLKDIFELTVLFACAGAIFVRAVIRPARYEGSHHFEAYLVLAFISLLMLTDMFYEGSGLLLSSSHTDWLPAAQLAVSAMPALAPAGLETLHHVSYWVHLLIFFVFLNLLPLSKHFHIVTALPNVFFRKLSKGSLKPARWDVSNLDELETMGVAKLEDFTWKHLLDLYTCTECGRCSDNCPANLVGRPLSPKNLTIKLREHAYRQFPIWTGKRDPADNGEREPMVGNIVGKEEIWSCTTCGACEEECPVFIEYIDKIIDMRRHLIETSQNPKTFNQILMQFEKTGNPFGKPVAKRGDWVKEKGCEPIRRLKEGDKVDVLYFVDSYASYDPRIQEIATSIAKGLQMAGVDFGILGSLEKDSGHQVRRLGEEGLFQLLVEENMETLKGIHYEKIVTTDPHAFNTLKKDYPLPLEVSHYAPYICSLIESGRLKPRVPPKEGHTYTYHDPCYLGRHNEIYEAPRKILRSLPGLSFVEMKRARDRSFCCGGGDVILWHEIEQEEVRMAVKRIGMAREAGADVIVTACPFCLIHFEDAIKTAGLEEEMKVVDLMELTLSTL